MMSDGRSASLDVAEIVLTGMDSIRSCGHCMCDFMVFGVVDRYGRLAQWHIELGALLNEK
jgi:hypothetical protein